MRRGKMIWEEDVYQDVTIEELGVLIQKIEEEREGGEGAPVEYEPEIDGTYTVSQRRFLKALWEPERELETINVKIKWDLNTVEWITKHICDDYFPIELEVCEKCGATYRKECGHKCEDTFEMTWQREQPKGEWNLVSEGFPEDKEPVLVTDRWGDIQIMERWGRHHGRDQWRTADSCWYTDDDIIAWKPLPEAYKETDND